VPQRTVASVKLLAWLTLFLLTGCGGSALLPEEANAGGASHSATSSNGDSGAFAAAGKMPGNPQDLFACSTPYAGPDGGPRLDGPTDLGGCADISDELVLARYQDRSADVPQGFYYEPSPSIVYWKTTPCSNSAEDTVARGAKGGLGTFVDSYSTDWFHEATYCSNDNTRTIVRDLRCDYFNGSKLKDPTPERLAYLAGLLWWSASGNRSGSFLLGHSVVNDDAGAVVELCTLFTHPVRSGSCAELQLISLKYLLRSDGTVEFGSSERARTLKADCR